SLRAATSPSSFPISDCSLQDKCGDVGGAPKLHISTKKFLKGHINKVNSVHFAGDSRHCVSGSLDGKLIIWDTFTTHKNRGKKTSDFEAHAGDVVSISLSPDGKQYVTGSVDKTCKLWDVREQSPKQTFFGHDADVNSVCFHPNGQAFATASEDKTARLFDIRSDQQLCQFEPPNKSCGFTSC
uniref:Uncharacterized protein n=1 Tax=Phlebotomus papatasi TaxID=29031 RepID=A0A1B0DLU1_PHLPP